MDVVDLGPDDVIPGRPFTSVDHNTADASSMRAMLADVRRVLREAEESSRRIPPLARFAWRVDDRTHRLVVCNEGRLREHGHMSAVGFFGLRRTNLDISPLEDANSAVVQEFPNYPGILSYGSMELGSGQWGNLVLHEEPEDADRWREGELHARAVAELSPIHYVCVRIHNAYLTAGLFEEPDVVIRRTKYFDYSGDSEWRAVRTLDPAGAR